MCVQPEHMSEVFSESPTRYSGTGLTAAAESASTALGHNSPAVLIPLTAREPLMAVRCVANVCRMRGEQNRPHQNYENVGRQSNRLNRMRKTGLWIVVLCILIEERKTVEHLCGKLNASLICHE